MNAIRSGPGGTVLHGARHGLCMAACLLLSGCSVPLLGALASAATVSNPTALLEERAEQQALASTMAVDEKSPQMETEAAYLQVVAQMQRKQLWFASLAHLDALEAKWKASDHSRILRADAWRHVGMQAESAQLYTQLLAGSTVAQARHGLGLLAAQSGHYGEAVAQLEAARQTAPTDALLLNDLGYALLHTEQAASARLPLMQAAQLAPQNPRIQANVALFLLLHGEGPQVTDWMNQHRMGESLRLQVFAQAQRMSALVLQAVPPVTAATESAFAAPSEAVERVAAAAPTPLTRKAAPSAQGVRP